METPSRRSYNRHRQPQNLSSPLSLATTPSPQHHNPRIRTRLTTPPAARPIPATPRLSATTPSPMATQTPTPTPTPTPYPMSPLSVESWHRTLSQTDGRDKLFRLFQYLCKLLRGLHTGQTSPSPNSLASRAMMLETLIASGRQVFRLFKWASVYARLRTVGLHAMADAALFGYYLMDNITFLCKAGMIRGDVKQSSRRAARFWLMAVVIGFVGGVREVRALRREEGRLMGEVGGGKSGEGAGEGRRELERVLRRKRLALMGCLKHGGDAVVAWNLSKGGGAHPALVGGCGVVSSCVGFWQVWPTYLPTD